MALLSASLVFAHLSLAVGVRMTSSNLSSAAPLFHCSCGGLSPESQLVRMMKLNYAAGDLDTEAKKWNLDGCYALRRLGYTLPTEGFVDHVLKKTRWSDDHVTVGRCVSDPDMCLAVFPGANGLDQVAGTSDFAPTALLHKLPNGTVQALSRKEAGDFPASEVYHYHKWYFQVYQELRRQVGASLRNSLASCKRIEVVGHSIGAALGGLWQWENADLPAYLFAVGPNLAWFGKAPDVGCRGRTIYNENDRVPQFRYFVDKSDGSRVRTANVPTTKLTKLSLLNDRYVPISSDCAADPPSKNYFTVPLAPFPSNYFMALNPGLPYHDLAAYIASMDQAFP